MNDPKHPMWPLARLVVLMLTLIAVLYMNVNSFDNDEYQIVKWFLLAASGTVGIEYLLQKILGGKNNA